MAFNFMSVMCTWKFLYCILAGKQEKGSKTTYDVVLPIMLFADVYVIVFLLLLMQSVLSQLQVFCLHCFDTVGWASGSASSL